MASQDEVTALVNDVVVAQDAFNNREKLLNAARKLVRALEDPTEEAWRFALQPCAQACMCSAWKCGLLHGWPKERMSSEDLARKSNANQKLIVRLMRALTIYGIFAEVEEEVYEHNALSKALSTPPLINSLHPMALRILPGISKLPEYLQSISFRNPGDDPTDKTLWQYTNDTDLDFFQWMQARPAQLNAFNASMAASTSTERAGSKNGFADLYPFESELGGSLSSSDEVVLVDVGGGYGQVLEDIRQHLPGMKGTMVLEDLPETVKGAIKLENVEVVPYNFFTTIQPVRGARAYLLRHILDDWPDQSCRVILQNILPGLVKGKSRLLIVEIILPPTDAPVFGTMMDINLMRYTGMNRTLGHWRELLESVGLEIVKIWPPLRHDSVIEAVPKAWLEK